MHCRWCAFFILFAPLICNAKIIPHCEPVDGALDASHVVIVKQLSPGRLQGEETFLGDAAVGQILELPGFQLLVEDWSFAFGRERVEPILPQMRILIFLKSSPAHRTPGYVRHYGDWNVAAPGNCYFWTNDPTRLDSLREMAADALDFRESWEAARDIPDVQQRVEALWPFLWKKPYLSFERTQAELQKIGPAAGDYIARKLPGLTRGQKDTFLNGFGAYRSEKLHRALIQELQRQKKTWTETLDHLGRLEEPADDYGVLFQGLVGLGGFEDRSDLPFIRELAVWAVRYRFKQVDDAALMAFEKMPEKANLPVIEAIWKEFSERPSSGNELHAYDIMKALNAHRYSEAIPLMAQFVNAGFAQEMARTFLAELTGVDYGGDSAQWLAWYEKSYPRTHH